MLENRDAWLDLVFRMEGGYSNHPDDPGRATNLGITQATLTAWRGEVCGPEEVKCLLEEEARDIYLSRYWGVMRGDQLPSGLDLYACDFAVNSGPARAAKILQEISGAKADSFIGPNTMAAIRAKAPLQLLLDYHAARMDYLIGLSTWDTFGKGWTNRCNKVLALARAKIDHKPTLTAMVNSKIVAGASVGVASAATVVVSTPPGQWAQMWDTARGVLDQLPGLAGGLPDALKSAEPGMRATIEHGQQVAADPGLAGHIGALVMLGSALYTIWRRYKQFSKGKV